MAELLVRPRRLRFNPVVRNLVAEARLDARAFVMPHFVLRDPGAVEEIGAMPGIRREGIDRLSATIESDLKLGIRAVLLFGVPGDDEPKHPDGRSSYADDAITPRAVAALKKRFGGDLAVITDVCLCAYTDTGHCGVIEGGRVANDPSLEHIARQAVAHAAAGADVVAPSDMMDGRVLAIRQALDGAGLVDTPIMSYSCKYASGYYGPFREAAHSAPQFGDRRSYQMDGRNRREALLEAELDVEEGADILMVKPGLAYLDVLRDIKENFTQPVAVYNVSGEYSMVKAAAARGWIDERVVTMENLHAFRRAGADIVITYHARQALAEGWL